VGCAAGGGVGATGAGVGGGGGGVAWVCTAMVPVIDGWMLQWYAKVPAFRNTKVNVPPRVSGPLSHAPDVAVVVCEAPSMFVHVTLSPTFTVSDAGVNAKFWIVTARAAASGAAYAIDA
jgi:hypothetical protein